MSKALRSASFVLLFAAAQCGGSIVPSPGGPSTSDGAVAAADGSLVPSGDGAAGTGDGAVGPIDSPTDGGSADDLAIQQTGAPSAVSDFVLTNQGGANNANANGDSSSHSQTIKWSAATAGDHPIDHYQIYRNGMALATTKALTYTDDTATASNDALPNDFSGTHFDAPCTIYSYDVAAVDSAGAVGPKAPSFTYWEQAGGVAAWGETAFNPAPPEVVMSWAEKSVVDGASPSSVSITTKSASDYIQPSSGAPGSPLWSFESGAFVGGFMELDVYPTQANQTFRMGIISRVTPGDLYNNAGVIIGNNAAYGPRPMVQNKWNHYRIPMGAGTYENGSPGSAPGLQMGLATFEGYISGKTLTVTSVKSGAMINPTMWLSATGMTADYILGPGPSDSSSKATGKGGTGTYDMNVSQTVGSAAQPVTFTAQRTNVYKWSMFDTSSSGGNLWYVDDIGFTTK